MVDNDSKLNIQKFSEIIKFLNEELNERVERTLGDIERNKLQGFIQRDKANVSNNMENDQNMQFEY